MKPTGFRRIAFAFVSPLVMSACAVGPNYQQPAAPLVTGYTPGPLPASTQVADGIAQRFVSGADISGEWWTLFHSPGIDQSD